MKDFSWYLGCYMEKAPRTNAQIAAFAEGFKAALDAGKEVRNAIDGAVKPAMLKAERFSS